MPRAFLVRNPNGRRRRSPTSSAVTPPPSPKEQTQSHAFSTPPTYQPDLVMGDALAGGRARKQEPFGCAARIAEKRIGGDGTLRTARRVFLELGSELPLPLVPPARHRKNTPR
ncbi:hypothetical protein HPB50_013371 [Hyalomma asiaticum]|uniref:Uncharacterized protein n=1 Tax=Hyalomma asiaticum TaxID=266040 RepID=A0ACB7SSJ7_HYAAI|nr:hypothetical protein HPB50_013371 [Hyalomma asiaticum]